MMIIKCFILAAFIRLLIATEKPFLCSGLYTSVALILGFGLGGKTIVVLISACIGFVLASIYFWLLDRVELASGLWWLIAIVGLAIGLV